MAVIARSSDGDSCNRRCVGAIVSLIASAVLAASGSASAALSTETVATNLTKPVYVTAPTGDPRLFMVERAGVIKVLQNGSVSSFLDITAKVESSSGERGLSTITFDPNFAINKRFYLDYTDKTSLNSVVASYVVSGNTALFEKNIITIQQDFTGIHKAGWIGFKPGDSSNLYISVGDGGGGYDPANRAQNTSLLQGKILRINPNGDDFPSDANANYSIPQDNPLAGQQGARGEIWAYGLRNPFRASFDRQTGDLWIGDVGQDAREEIDFQESSQVGIANYGWRLREGNFETQAPTGGPIPANYVAPIYDYGHPGGGAASVTGGYVYRGTRLPELYGSYIFGDFVLGKIWSFKRLSDGSITAFTDLTGLLGDPVGPYSLASFGEDGFGELFLVDYGSGTVIALIPEPSAFLMMALGLGVLLIIARRGQMSA